MSIMTLQFFLNSFFAVLRYSTKQFSRMSLCGVVCGALKHKKKRIKV